MTAAGATHTERYDVIVQYRLRTVHVAVEVTVMAVALLAVVPALPGHPTIAARPYVALLVTAAGGAGVAGWLVPWPRLFLAGLGEPVMYVWSALDIVLVTLVAGVAGGPGGDLVLLYALTTVFFAASYPGRGQIGLFALTCGCYLALCAWWQPHPAVATVVVRLGVVAMVWFMAAFLARERTRELAGHAQARQLAEHRATLLAAVARTAASITTLDSDDVMGGVADSLMDLGYDATCFCVLEAGGRRYRVRQPRGLPAGYVDAVQPATTGVVAHRRAGVGEGRHRRRPSEVASPAGRCRRLLHRGPCRRPSARRPPTPSHPVARRRGASEQIGCFDGVDGPRARAPIRRPSRCWYRRRCRTWCAGEVSTLRPPEKGSGALVELPALAGGRVPARCPGPRQSVRCTHRRRRSSPNASTSGSTVT